MVLLLPVYFLLSLLVVFFSGFPVFFVQKRVGKDGKFFRMYKFRTMKVGAEDERNLYLILNEAYGPVFKIRNDPRLTRIGRFLCHTGLDEIPQLLNIVKGDMDFVGPRPLPIYEENKIPEKYRFARRKVNPGILSVWVLNGYHKMSFDDWMSCDLEYIKNKSHLRDLMIFIKGILFVFGLFQLEFREVKEKYI
jgi:lipopolysaccharide/colanic/teichoic acid biosynthesis glycosyltransferase